MRDTLCAYYTDSQDITSYMVKSLNLEEGDRVLEPSAGEGTFIDAILRTGLNVSIDALDIEQRAISVLRSKYADSEQVMWSEGEDLLQEPPKADTAITLRVKLTDTLLDDELDFAALSGGQYDKIVGNPPYGAWQDYDKRADLKKRYPGQYVKETYSLFMLRCLSLLKHGGRLSFIVPDTYLYLNLHERLRHALLTTTQIERVLIFPSKLFPGISFGYSNLSIITIRRCDEKQALNNTVNVVTGFRDASEFSLVLGSKEKAPEHLTFYNFLQSEILTNPQERFLLTDTATLKLIKHSPQKLGDIADVVTGFYTGDNKRFLRVANASVKGSKGYEIVDAGMVEDSQCVDGLSSTNEGYIPYIKSAPRRRYLRDEDEWFVRWDAPTIEHYKRDKKARFQNSSYYFRPGIGIPMVKSSSIRAFYMSNRLFDQSIVGIFPRDEKYLYFILALMNSDVVNELIHLLNPTANNSSNYVKQIPVLLPSENILHEIDSLVEKTLSLMREKQYSSAERVQEKLNDMIVRIYSNEEGRA